MKQQIPERTLSDLARARRRAELMDAISDERPASRRWLAPIAAAAAVAVVGGAVYLGSGLNDVEPGPATSATGTGGPSECVEGLPGGLLPVSVNAVLQTLQAYRDVVADHLDPGGRHLQAWPINVHTLVSELGSCHLSKQLGWTIPGEDGLGMLQVDVSRSWDHSPLRLAHRGWRSIPPNLPGVTYAFTVEYDGGMAVAATRTDGLTVAIDAYEVDAERLLILQRSQRGLFDDYSATGFSGFDFDVDDLLATVTDTRFTLPQRG